MARKSKSRVRRLWQPKRFVRYNDATISEDVGHACSVTTTGLKDNRNDHHSGLEKLLDGYCPARGLVATVKSLAALQRYGNASTAKTKMAISTTRRSSQFASERLFETRQKARLYLQHVKSKCTFLYDRRDARDALAIRRTGSELLPSSLATYLRYRTFQQPSSMMTDSD